METLILIAILAGTIYGGFKLHKVIFPKKPLYFNTGSKETHKDENCRALKQTYSENLEMISERKFKKLHKKGKANGCAICFPEQDDDSTNLSIRIRDLFRKW